MSRVLRLCWICLLALTLPLKGWALVSGAHCQGQVHVPVVAVAVEAAADAAACPHHAARQGADTDADTSAPQPPQAGTDNGHTCSACAHCNTGTAPPSIWLAPVAADMPHAPPEADTTRWQSATLRQLDRPPTRRTA